MKMNMKKIIGIAVIILGLGMIIASMNITSRVESGRIEIADGQRKVDQTNTLFSYNSTTKQIGKGFTDGGQSKINKGIKTAADYEALAERLNLWGIIFLVVGAAVVALGLWKRKT